MTALSQTLLEQLAQDKSVIFTQGRGPCPVFARGDRRTRATHWLSRDMVMALEKSGLLTPVPYGLALSTKVKAQRG